MPAPSVTRQSLMSPLLPGQSGLLGRPHAWTNVLFGPP